MSGHGFGVGDRVVLLRLNDWFSRLEPEVVEDLKSCVGRQSTIVSFDEFGRAELEFWVATDRCHTIWVDPDEMKKV